jgi:hypothetical protein
MRLVDLLLHVGGFGKSKEYLDGHRSSEQGSG